ncbi:hypothetical protein BDZ89DRAFT_506922 [Hymenopellis radicata]|nr:hypothetical protein BDZ89DRAFT_506922 [Hymenopellis radicata]
MWRTRASVHLELNRSRPVDLGSSGFGRSTDGGLRLGLLPPFELLDHRLTPSSVTIETHMYVVATCTKRSTHRRCNLSYLICGAYKSFSVERKNNFYSPFHSPLPGIDTLIPSHTFLATSPSSNNTLTTPHAPPVSRSTRASTPFTTPYALKYFLNAAALVNGDKFENSNAFGGGGGKVDACPNGPPRTESYSYDSSYNSMRIFFLPPGRRLGSTIGSSTAGSRIHRVSSPSCSNQQRNTAGREKLTLPGTCTHAPSSNTSPFTLTNTSLSLSFPLSFSLPFPPRTLLASSGRPASPTRTASMR